MHDPRIQWEQQVAAGLAAKGVSITALPDGALASAFIEGVSAQEFVEWATTTAAATANAAAPSVAASQKPPRSVFPPVTPTAHPPAQAPIRPPVPGKPVKPAATLATVGASVYFLGSVITGVGETILFGGEAVILLGGLVGTTGVILAQVGLHRFLTAHDRGLPGLS